MYNNGEGVPRDYQMARMWCRKAADQGLANAQYNLGVMYNNGEGVPRDYIQAHKWFTLASANRCEGAAKARKEIASVMTAQQIAEAQRLVREWQKEHE
jgi:TPR repeat protein